MRVRSLILKWKTVNQVIRYAQSPKITFEDRRLAGRFNAKLEWGIEHLKLHFPETAGSLLQELGDSSYSRVETLIRHNKIYLSNVSLYHLSIVLTCMQYSEVNRVVELGGGYGGLARLFLLNSLKPVEKYYVIDLPESLFFCEVFLRANFPDKIIAYITDGGQRPNDEADIVLCPVHHLNSLDGMPFDLLINTGSLGEMPDEYVDFYMKWLDRMPIRHFYSLNYFAMPLHNRMEGRNNYSPRPSSKWHACFLHYDPLIVSYTGCPRIWAEILYANSDLVNVTDESYFDHWKLLQELDKLRGCETIEKTNALLSQCRTLPVMPKEAGYLQSLLSKGSDIIQ